MTSKVVKFKLNKFTKDDKILERINLIVEQENYLTSLVSFFLKSFSLYLIEHGRYIEINIGFIRTAYAVFINYYKGEEIGRGRKITTNAVLFEEMKKYFNQKFKLHITLVPKMDFTNMSHILSASAEQLLTAYENNITVNYITYVNKYVNFNLFDSSLSGEERKSLRKELRKVKTDLLENTLNSDEKYHKWIREERPKIIPDVKSLSDLMEQLSNNPISLHKYMIFMGSKFEELNFRTNQQFPLRKSFGKHIQMCSQAMIDILVNKKFDYEHINIFNSYHQEIKDKSDLISPKLKENLSEELKKMKQELVEYQRKIKIEEDKKKEKNKEKKKKTTEKKEKENNPELDKLKTELDNIRKKFRSIKMKHNKEKAEIKTEIWKLFFNFNNKIFRNKRFSFGNSIRTDGYSVSIYMTSVEDSYLNRKERSNNKKLNDSYQYLDELDSDEIKKITGDEDNIFVGVDPGKKNLIQMVDGKGHTFRYTAIQRRRELQVEKLNNKMRNFSPKSDFTDNSKSNNLDIFHKYISNKSKVLINNFEKLNKNILKNISFNRYVLARKSNDKLENKIKDAFNPPSSDKKESKTERKIRRDKTNITLLYGNWSFTKQMRNFISTPGIGLKNKLRKSFKIFNIDEFRTSKMCYSCENETEKFLKIDNPKKKNEERFRNWLKKNNIKFQKWISRHKGNGQKSKKMKRLSKDNFKQFKENEHNKNREESSLCHSLLRCKNDKCYKIWSRDMNGSLNILKVGTFILDGKGRPSELCRKKQEQVLDKAWTNR